MPSRDLMNISSAVSFLVSISFADDLGFAVLFGDGGEGFLRINLATSLENVLDAAKRLETYIKGLK